MKSSELADALKTLVGSSLAKELAEDFVKIRQDYATKTLERASCGKFVEVFVQCLQQMASNKFDLKPNVDDYLDKKVENELTLSEGLRICAARVARSVYTMRNKRNIAHKNSVDPNISDLAFIHQGAAWIMAELIRSATGITMHEAGRLIELVQAPVGTLVEEIEGIRLVHADVSLDAEILILLHSHYPEYLSKEKIAHGLVRRKDSSIRASLSRMRSKKWVFGEAKIGYRLTQAGHSAAVNEIGKLLI